MNVEIGTIVIAFNPQKFLEFPEGIIGIILGKEGDKFYINCRAVRADGSQSGSFGAHLFAEDLMPIVRVSPEDRLGRLDEVLLKYLPGIILALFKLRIR